VATLRRQCKLKRTDRNELKLDTNKNTDTNKLSLTIYGIIILAVIFGEFMTFDKAQIYHQDIFSLAMGFVGYFGIFMHSQKIIDDNSFKQFAIVGLLILIVCIVKQTLTGFNQLPIFVAGLPLLYVGYFRVLTSLFFSNYPDITKKPTIIFASTHGQAYFDGKEDGYKPPMKERFFSLLLFIGFMFFAFGLIWLLKNILS